MKLLRSNKGVSYLEVSIAIGILAVVLSAIILSISSISTSFSRSHGIYNNSLHANSLLVEVSNTLATTGIGGLLPLTSSDRFHTQYETNTFSYEVHISYSNTDMILLIQDGVSYFTTNIIQDINPPALVFVSIYMYEDDDRQIMRVFRYIFKNI